MALTFTNFTRFEEVEAYYNSITPMRGTQNIGKDIRPIGDRNRKWERIVKISPQLLRTVGWLPPWGCALRFVSFRRG